MAPHSSTLAWKIPWMEEPGRLQSMGSLGVGHDSVTSLSLFTFKHWRRKQQSTPAFLPGESQGRGSLVGCRLWGRTESDTTEATYQQQHKRSSPKSRKSRNTWSNRQICLGMQNEAGQRLIEFCQENALVTANTLFQQHKRRLYTWTSPDGQHRNQTDHILCSQRWRSSIQSAKNDQELTVAQIMNSLLPISDLN